CRLPIIIPRDDNGDLLIRRKFICSREETIHGSAAYSTINLTRRTHPCASGSYSAQYSQFNQRRLGRSCHPNRTPGERTEHQFNSIANPRPVWYQRGTRDRSAVKTSL